MVITLGCPKELLTNHIFASWSLHRVWPQFVNSKTFPCCVCVFDEPECVRFSRYWHLASILSLDQIRVAEYIKVALVNALDRCWTYHFIWFKLTNRILVLLRRRHLRSSVYWKRFFCKLPPRNALPLHISLYVVNRNPVLVISAHFFWLFVGL